MIELAELNRIARWAQELSPGEADRARRGINIRSYQRGAYLCHLGDKFDAWVGIVSGLVKLSTMSDEGKVISLAGLPTGAWLGEGSILKNEPRRYDLIALRDCRVALMDNGTFFWLFEHSVGFNRFLVRQFNERLGQFIGQLENERLMDAQGRVAHALAVLFNPDLYPDVGSHLELSQEEIALLSGLSRQATNQALKTLEADGVLVCERGGVTIGPWKGLTQYGRTKPL